MPTLTKTVWSVKAYDDVTATAVYSCLSTLCNDWGLTAHYGTVARVIRKDGIYKDSKVLIKRHALIRASVKRK